MVDARDLGLPAAPVRQYSDSLLEELGLALQTQQVGTQGNGRMMIPGALLRGHKAIAESWGFFHLRFHDLRQTHATLLST